MHTPAIAPSSHLREQPPPMSIRHEIVFAISWFACVRACVAPRIYLDSGEGWMTRRMGGIFKFSLEFEKSGFNSTNIVPRFEINFVFICGN